jgi:hypothetical protein
VSTVYYCVDLKHLMFYKSFVHAPVCYVCVFVLSVSSVIETQGPALCLVRGERGGVSGSRDSEGAICDTFRVHRHLKRPEIKTLN